MELPTTTTTTTTTKQQRYYQKNQSSILQKLQNKRKLLPSLPPSLQTRFYCLLHQVKKENREFLNWTNNIRLVNREILSPETKKKTCIETLLMLEYQRMMEYQKTHNDYMLWITKIYQVHQELLSIQIYQDIT